MEKSSFNCTAIEFQSELSQFITEIKKNSATKKLVKASLPYRPLKENLTFRQIMEWNKQNEIERKICKMVSFLCNLCFSLTSTI